MNFLGVDSVYNLRVHEIMSFLLGSDATDERVGVYYPLLDVYESNEALIVEVEVPGVEAEDVEVEVLGRTLRITGQKRDGLDAQSVRYLRMERGFGRFARELEVPERFDLETVEARFTDGVLSITISRAPSRAEVVRHIAIE
ncbi:MAG: Spore protein SP21 [Deltaproteobacteria bacterium ADurb.Bin510]|nr:MAG: Spore protein SP21 [Deltaproteobacteria bacterium ADurb.Bin510]